MQEGFAAKNKITDRGNSLNYGGDGRYVYIVNNASGGSRLFCYDSSLLVASNYLGSGSWTVNPLIATINISTAAALVYVPSRMEIWIPSGTTIERINANPSSGSFNTVVGSFTHSVSSFQPYALVYNSKNDCVLGMPNLININCKSLKSAGSITWFISAANNDVLSFIACNHIQGLVQYHGGFAFAATVFDPLTQGGNTPAFSSNFNSTPQLITVGDDYIFRRTAANFGVTKYPYNSLLASLSVSSQTLDGTSNRYGYCRNLQRVYIPNGNSIRRINLSPTISDGGTISKGSIVLGEIGCGIIMQANNEQVLLVQAKGGSNNNTFHIFNPVNDTYVGYFQTPTPYLADFASNHVMCKNQLEL